MLFLSSRASHMLIAELVVKGTLEVTWPTLPESASTTRSSENAPLFMQKPGADLFLGTDVFNLSVQGQCRAGSLLCYLALKAASSGVS